MCSIYTMIIDGPNYTQNLSYIVSQFYQENCKIKIKMMKLKVNFIKSSISLHSHYISKDSKPIIFYMHSLIYII